MGPFHEGNTGTAVGILRNGSNFGLFHGMAAILRRALKWWGKSEESGLKAGEWFFESGRVVHLVVSCV